MSALPEKRSQAQNKSNESKSTTHVNQPQEHIHKASDVNINQSNDTVSQSCKLILINIDKYY